MPHFAYFFFTMLFATWGLASLIAAADFTTDRRIRARLVSALWSAGMFTTAALAYTEI